MTNDPNAEILTASEFAVGVAKKELGKTLDYSKHSLKDLEALIQHVKNHFLKLNREGKLTEQTVQRASLSIGGYLGEVIRRSYGGTWIAKNTIMKALIINGKEFSPILYVFERLTKDLDYSLENYLSDMNQKLNPQPSIDENLPVPEAPKKTTNVLTGNRSLIVGGIIGIAVLCIIGILAIRIFSNIKATNESKVKINNFLVEANKLNSMTEQGVTYQEFRTQLIEVTSSYALIDYWPSSYRDEKLAFDKAMEGWQWTLTIWKYKLDIPATAYHSNDVAEYLGVDVAVVSIASDDELIGALLGQASTYFEAGKAGVK